MKRGMKIKTLEAPANEGTSSGAEVAPATLDVEAVKMAPAVWEAEVRDLHLAIQGQKKPSKPISARPRAVAVAAACSAEGAAPVHIAAGAGAGAGVNRSGPQKGLQP